MLLGGVAALWTPHPRLQLTGRLDTNGEGKAAATLVVSAPRVLGWLLPRAPPPDSGQAAFKYAVVDFEASQERRGALTVEAVHCPGLDGTSPFIAAAVYEMEHSVVIARKEPSHLSKLTARVSSRAPCLREAPTRPRDLVDLSAVPRPIACVVEGLAATGA